MRLKYVFVLALGLLASHLNAQLHYGFKTGLNFARFDGPSEVDNTGKSLETWKNVTGFHIGASFSHPFTDNFGLRAELLYSKRGAKYTYDGPSYRVFNLPNSTTTSIGTARYLVSINNSYLDLPIMAYGRVGDFEVSAGGYVGLLLQMVGDGSLVYKDASNSDLQFNLRYNYRKDAPGGGEDGEKVIAVADGRQLELPKTIGAYYDYPEDRGSLYKALDYGLMGGVAYYFSSSLYFGVRIQYGLADITKNSADLAHANLNASTPSYRNDKDRNFVLQASVGFGF